MIRTLCLKSANDSKLLLAALLVLMFCLPWLFIWMSSKISLPAFSSFLANALPERWERLSGVPFSQVATPAGRIALVFVHPLIMLGATVWAVARGSDSVSGEIGRGTMEMLLAQPIRRTTLFVTQALVTVLGGAVLATFVWLGIAVGLATVLLPEAVSVVRFLPAAVNLFAFTVCLGGMSALASSWESQRWRTIGLVSAVYAISTLLKIVGQISDGWAWVGYASFLNAYEPQAMVAQPADAWSLFTYYDGAINGLGLGGRQLVLLGLGLLCYMGGAVIFNRREIPAPL